MLESLYSIGLRIEHAVEIIPLFALYCKYCTPGNFLVFWLLDQF